MTPHDIAKQNQIDPEGAAETKREHMQHGNGSTSPNWTAAVSMGLLMVIGGTFSVYALPWGFKIVITLIGGLF